MPTILERYSQTFAASAARFERAKTLFPTGVTHDTRMLDPFPVFIERAKGSRKWDVQGTEFVDYFVGHGSHLLGHSAPDVVLAVQKQMERGTHPGASHDLELEWAELVKQLIPSAERVRFTGSGTEATMMCLRLARLATGQPKFLKFHGHFHGWHDVVTVSADPPYKSNTVPGVPADIASCCVAIPPNDLNLVEQALRNDASIGAVILEPTGGHWGAVPVRGEFLRGLRDICNRLERVLIFDEVITGFRVSSGGAQKHYGVTPDLTALAKILAGGLPGGCVAGREDILSHIEPRAGRPKMKHPGTYNGNPLSASAGIATLKRIAAGGVCEAANNSALSLRNQLNDLFAKHGFRWVAYGDFSMIRVLPNYDGPRPADETTLDKGFVPLDGSPDALDGPKNMKQVMTLRQAMFQGGVDWWGLAGMTSCEHNDTDVSMTVKAMELALLAMREEGVA
jgi:glutamate-1-semialdehyde 2,1-aminomutase